MSGIIFIPNQGVKFLVDEESVNIRNYECKGDNSEFCQIVNKDYPTQFQVKIADGGGAELLTNPGFDTDLTGWTLPGQNLAVWNDTNVGEGALQLTMIGGCRSFSQIVSITEGKTYKIRVNVCEIIRTNKTALVSIAPTVITDPGGVALTVVGDGATVSGEYEYSFYANYTGNVSIGIQACVGGTNGNTVRMTFCEVSMFEGVAPEFYLYDCDDLLVDTLTAEVDGEYAMVTVQWGNYPEGCYKLCVYPDGNLGENLLGDSLCLGTATGEPIILGDFSDCIGIIV